MELQPLTAISPVDGRYRKQSEHLSEYFSEFALIKQRVVVEVEYFFSLADEKLFTLPAKQKTHLQKLVTNFSLKDAEKIKGIEATTNHDVKAVEYFLKEELQRAGGKNITEWIHFGLTSQDINNTAIPLLWKDAVEKEYLSLIAALKNSLTGLAKDWKNVAMLAYTHGQPASPTTLGKEIIVFAGRIQNQLELFKQIPFTAKFGGATGNFNAHVASYPKIDWIRFADQFVESKLKLKRQQFTTQIEHYDMLAAHFDNIKRINTILIDLCRDVWQYISMNYFKQKINKNEVGSSAMPHKVNPIDFENAEGNLGIANALLEHLSAKLPVSRLQRDLTDSTVIRNIGVPMAHTIISIKAIQKGLGKLILNEQKIKEDLDNNWAVVAEAIQTVLRRENYPQPYETLKELTRNNTVLNKNSIHTFIDSLKVSSSIKRELKAITPHTYIGITPKY
jgi:adenylosuccinate lyase